MQCEIRKLMDSCSSFSIVNFTDGGSLLNLLSVCSMSHSYVIEEVGYATHSETVLAKEHLMMAIYG
jgi:hypothetical protein